MEILKHLHVIRWPRRTYIERQITYLQNPNGLPFLVLKHYQHLQVSTNIPLTTESRSLPCNQPKLSTSKPVKRSKFINTVTMCFNSFPSIPPVALLSWLLKTVPRLSLPLSLSPLQFLRQIRPILGLPMQLRAHRVIWLEKLIIS